MKKVIYTLACMALLIITFSSVEVRARADAPKEPETSDSFDGDYEELRSIDFLATAENGWAAAGHSGVRVYYVTQGESHRMLYWTSDNQWMIQDATYENMGFGNSDVSGIDEFVINDYAVYWLNGSLDTPKVSSEAAPPTHTHNFVTGVIYDATCDYDGLEGTYCKTCGYILNSSPISAFGYALYTDATQKITAAKSGQKIILEFKELNSFPKAFMEKIAARVAEGVSFEFRYNVNHELQKITIPAYSTVDTSLDWYGYAKMAELYGAN